MKHILKSLIKSRVFAAFIFIAFVFFALVMLFNIGPDARHTAFMFGSGNVDLTDFDFSNSLAGIYRQSMHFYAGEFLLPGNIDTHAPDDYETIKTVGYGTMRVRLAVPEGDYLIYGKTPEYASRIYVNGELRAAFGQIDEVRGNTFRTDKYELAVHPDGGIIEIVMHNASDIRPYPEYYTINLGDYELAQSYLMAEQVKIITVLGLFAVVAMVFLSAFMFMPHAKANLWFALLLITYGFRLAIADKTMLQFFPEADYSFIFLAETGSFVFISTFYILLIRALFGESVPKVFVKTVIAINVVPAAALLFLPISIVAGYMWFNTAFLSIVALLTAIFIARHITRLKDEQIISFAGQLVFVYVGIAMMFAMQTGIWLFPLNILPVIEDMSLYGMLFFVFAQVLVLFLHNSRAVENERRLAAENALLEKRNDMKTELLGNISHEMKTPLTVISNISQLALHHTDDDYIRDKMETVITEVERMKVKTNQLLKATKLDDAGIPWNFEPVDIRSLIDDTIFTYFRTLDEHNNTLSVDLHENLPYVKADQKHLPGVIVNLIENAVHYTHGGNITVSASVSGGFVTVSVEDTGSGMTPQQMERIFERFYTGEKSTGTGLGLYICKKVIDAHGGEISLKSEPGCGTKVWFTVPVWEGIH